MSSFNINPIQDNLKHKSLLPDCVAHIISRWAVLTRLGLKFAGIIVESSLELSKTSAETSFGFSKKALAVVSSVVDSPQGETVDSARESYLEVGIYMVQHAFTLAEYMTISALDYTHSGVKMSFGIADEAVKLVDSVFGSTETSKVLASFVRLVTRQVDSDGELKISIKQRLLKVKYITKTVIAFALTQRLHLNGCLEDKAAVCTGEKSLKTKKSLAASLKSNAESLKSLLESHCSANTEQQDRKTRLRLFMGIGDSSDSDDEISDRNLRCAPDKTHLKFSSEALNGDDIALPKEEKTLLSRKRSRVSIKSSIFSAKTLRDKKAGWSVTQLARYCRFASAAYGDYFISLLDLDDGPEASAHDAHSSRDWASKNIAAFAKHAGVPLADVAGSSYHRQACSMLDVSISSPTVEHVIYYIAVDHMSRSIVLSLRGTLGLNDLFIDLTCQYSELWLEKTVSGRSEKCFAGHVHAGMLKCALLLLDPAGPIFVTLRQAIRLWPEYQICIAGHSLGAGVSSILALLMAKELEDGTFVVNSNTGLVNDHVTPLHCFAFGPPAVMSAELSNRCKSLVTSVIANDDIVPHLSLGLIYDFQKLASLVGANPVEDKKISQLLKEYCTLQNRAVTAEHLTIASEVYTWFIGNMQTTKLYPPGQVLWIKRKPEQPSAKSGSWLRPFAAAVSYFYSDIDTNSNSSNKADTLPVDIVQVDNVAVAFGVPFFTSKMLIDHSPKSYQIYLSCLNVRDSL